MPATAGAMQSASTGAAASRLTTLGRRNIVPGDLLDIVVFDVPELSRAVRVSNDGSVTLPLVGLVAAAGRTPQELEGALKDTLRKTYMRDPHVTVDIKEAALRPIYVVGEVKEPGAFTAMGDTRLTVLRAVALARGFTPAAAQHRAIVIRPQATGDPLQFEVNLEDAVNGRSSDIALQPNDVVYVPTNKQRAIAMGVVDAALRVVTFRTVF